MFGGRAEVTFKSYALNSEEIDKINYELKKSELGDVLGLIEGTSTESLSQLEEEINFFLEDKTEEEKKKSSDESNPFFALLGMYDKSPAPKAKGKGKNEPKEVIVHPDDFIEKTLLRPVAAENAVEKMFTMFDTYKKAHAMVSFT